MPLLLRHANASRQGGPWQHDDFDVLDGERHVGRIYLVDAYGGNETWFGASASSLPGARATGTPRRLAKAAFSRAAEI